MPGLTLSSLRRLTPQAISIGSWETIESINEDERALGAESAASDCGSNKKYFKLDIRTDNYGFETSWILAKKQSNTLEKIASGPPSGTIYRDNNMYSGGELFRIAYDIYFLTALMIKWTQIPDCIRTSYRILSVSRYLQVHYQGQIQGWHELWKRRQLHGLRRRDEKVWIT